MKTMSILMAVSAVVLLVAIAGPAQAYEYPGFVLKDDNSLVAVHYYNGVERWDVDQTAHLGVELDEALQWFWYREGSAGGEQQVNPVNLTLDTQASRATDANGDGWDDVAYLVYHDPDRFDVEVKVSLDGGPLNSGQSDLAEQVTITNTTADETLDLYWFQYADFDLGDTPDDDQVVYLGEGTAEMQEVVIAKQVDGTYELIAAEVASVPFSHVEANVDNAIQDELNDPLTTVLDDTTTASGNVEWAVQWHVNLAPGEAFQFSADKMITIIPEPAAMVILTAGGLATRGRGRRRGQGRRERLSA